MSDFHDHSSPHKCHEKHDNPPTDSVGISEEQLEKAHWYDVMRTFLMYEEFIGMDIRKRQTHLNRLPVEYANALPDSTFNKINDLVDAAKQNQMFFEDVVDFQDYNFAPRPKHFRVDKYAGNPIHISQMHRNQAVLHSLAREWSVEGAEERAAAFNPILDAIQEFLPVTKENRHQQRVLVPGCGLARLPLEIAALGYACEANEYSMFMLTVSHFILNGVSEPNYCHIFPWLDRVSNIVSISDILTPISIPDVSALDVLNSADPESVGASNDPSDGPRFSMAAGNFVEVYGNESNAGEWDCIVTCFFVDTAPVVMDYIKTIKSALRPGGYWINIGPLLYHWASSDPGVASGMPEDERYSQSVELSWEELHHVICYNGFEILKEDWKDCTYTRAKNSMLWNTYRAKFFVARKGTGEQS